MTPEQIEIHRKRFESLCDSSFIGRFPSGTYHWSFIQESWNGYLLCAENMPVIEAPSDNDISDLAIDTAGEYDWDTLEAKDKYITAFTHGALMMSDNFSARLAAAGIKYNIKE